VVELGLHALMGISILDTAVILSEDRVAIVGRHSWTNRNAPPVAVIHTISSGENVTAELPGGSGWRGVFARDGNLVILLYNQEDDRDTDEIVITPQGEVSRQRLEPSNRYSLHGGETVILEYERSLWLLNEATGETTLLLKGNPADNDTVVSFYFFEAIDEHRFVYGIAGWEGILGAGIFDVSSMTDTRVDNQRQHVGPHPHRVIGDRLYLLDYEYELLGGVIMDLLTYEIVKMPESIFTYHTSRRGYISHFAFSPDGTMIALVHYDMDTTVFRNHSTVTVFRVFCGTVIAKFTIECSGASVQHVNFINNSTLFLHGGSISQRLPYVFIAYITAD